MSHTIETQSTQIVSMMKRQLEEAQKRASEAEKRVAELGKKNEDYKRAYNELKTNLGKAQKDLEESKQGSKPEVNEQEVREKYEALKVKHKVSRKIKIKTTLGSLFR